MVEGHVPARAWGFKSPLRHHETAVQPGCGGGFETHLSAICHHVSAKRDVILWRERRSDLAWVGLRVLEGSAGMELDLYAGVRMSVPARLTRAERVLRLDVNVGDPVTPAPTEVPYPSLLGEPLPVYGYSIEAVLAEKVVTMIARGDATTRERDFAAVALLARRHEIDGARLEAAIRATAGHRGTELRPVNDVLMTLGRYRQSAWSAFLRGSGLEAELPASY